MSEYEFVKVEQDGRITLITINRPHVYNALHSPAHIEFDQVFDEFASDPKQWVAIITGAGDKAFSAGNDLKYQAAGGRRDRPANGFAGLTERFNLNKPVYSRGQQNIEIVKVSWVFSDSSVTRSINNDLIPLNIKTEPMTHRLEKLQDDVFYLKSKSADLKFASVLDLR